MVILVRKILYRKLWIRIPIKFMPYNYRTVSSEDYKNYIKNTKLEYLHILLTRVGSNIGHSAVIDKKLDFAIYVILCLIKPIKKFIDSKYICLWLNSPDGTKKSLDNILGKIEPTQEMNFIRNKLSIYKIEGRNILLDLGIDIDDIRISIANLDF